jgi:hypothetical protein
MMRNVYLSTFSAFVLLAATTLIAGCGEAGPPPGAPATTQAPTIEPSPEQSGAETQADAPAAAQPTETKTAQKDAGGEWGTLTGRIVYVGTPPKAKNIEPTKDVEVCGKHAIPDENLIVSSDGGIKDAVVMLRTKNVPVAPSYADFGKEALVLDNKNCRFEPHVAVVLTKQPVALKNSDPIGHNSKFEPFSNPPINPILPVGGDPIDYKFTTDEALPVNVTCNIHPWMHAYLVVRSDPYAAVTDADGKFTIKDLPAGKDLEFGLWQENSGYLKNATFKGGKADNRGRFKFKLKPGENDLGDIKVPSSVFKKN